MSRYKSLVKVAVGAVLIAWLLMSLDLQQFAACWSAINWKYFVLAFAIFPLMIAVSVVRWRLLLACQGISCGLGRLAGLCATGGLLNSFLPTSVAGDVFKAYSLGRDHGNLSRSAAAIFVDRLLGLFVVLLFACIAYGTELRHLHNWFVDIGFTAVLGGFGAISLVTLLPRLARGIPCQTFHGRDTRLVKSLRRWMQDVELYRKKKGTVAAGLALALTYHLLGVVGTFWAVRALTVSGSFYGVLMLLPGAFLVGAIPISIGGIGVAEWGYLYFFGLMGVSPESAVAVGLLIRARTVTFGLLGLASLHATPADAAAAQGESRSDDGISSGRVLAEGGR